MVDEFYKGTDWQSSSGPIISRQLTTADLWPEGPDSESNGTGDKDDLADGLHPILAIGPKANRPSNMVCSVMTYLADADLAQVNIAPGHIVKQYVANVLTYSTGSPNTYDTSLAVGDPVYVDDSDSLDSGVTCSRSPLNDDNAANPLAGYIWYDQNDYADFHVGGPNASAGMPITVAESLVYTKVSVLIWPVASYDYD